MFQYFYDDEYKRKVAIYYSFSRRYLENLKAYDSRAKTTVVLLEERIKK